MERIARDENTGNIGLINTTLRDACPAGERMRYDHGGGRDRGSQGFNHWLEDNLAEKTAMAAGEGALRQEVRSVLATARPLSAAGGSGGDLVKVRTRSPPRGAQTVEQALADVARQHATAHLHSVGQAGAGRGNGLRQIQDL